MLTQNKEEALRRLQAIDTEQQASAAAFAEICSICALLARELEPALPSSIGDVIDETIVDAVFNLSKAAEGVSGALRVAASMGARSGNDRTDWEGFLKEADHLRKENESLLTDLSRLAGEGALVPDRGRIASELQSLHLQREACARLRQALSSGQGEVEDVDVTRSQPSECGLDLFAEWRAEASMTVDQWSAVLDRHESVLQELTHWCSIVEAVRRHLGELGSHGRQDDRSFTARDGGKREQTEDQPIGTASSEADDPAKQRMSLLGQQLDQIEDDSRSGRWVDVLRHYDRMLEIDPENSRAKRERPLALCCFVENLLPEHAPSQDLPPATVWRAFLPHADHGRESTEPYLTRFFTPLCQKHGLRRAAETLVNTDLQALIHRPIPSWVDNRMVKMIWMPLFQKKATLSPDEQRYLSEFEKAFQ